MSGATPTLRSWRSPAEPSTLPDSVDSDDPYPGHWLPHEVPVAVSGHPEGSVLGDELIALARRELDKLPERQRVVVTMRDMLGLDSAEVCELLDISVANQRVLLHRGRAAVRQVLEDYLRETT